MCSIKKVFTALKGFASSGKILPWLCLVICLVSLSLSYTTSRSVDAMETRVTALEQSISSSLTSIDQTLASIDVRFQILEKYAAEKWEWLYGDATRPTVEIHNNVESKTKSKSKR